ncbi:MAG: hypothetical protein K1Y02_21185 [Candidatus Hydrogenedentes bacterium]|nr:hypothetical protein [Candidatus Hydrogenedentota bacterium]
MSDNPEAGGKRDEKMRLCPTCRMEISALAIKCRFCGEPVGRPRDESRALTIDDLGGETIRHYAPSSSVMEAMEAFRAETEVSSNPPADALPNKKNILGWVGKKSPMDSKAPSVSDGLPSLDEKSRALAELAMPSKPSTPVRRPVNQGPTWIKQIGVFAGLVASIIILYFGGNYVWAVMTRKPAPPPPTYVNPAKAILEQGGDPVEALQEAIKALRREPHPDNELIASEARRKLVAAVNDMLNTKPWKEEDLRRAQSMIGEAFKSDSSESIRTLKEEVDQEYFSYRMTLVETTGNSATFRLNNKSKSVLEKPDASDTVTVKVGDTIADRFTVMQIKKDFVQVQDSLRQNRLLTFNRNSAEIASP